MPQMSDEELARLRAAMPRADMNAGAGQSSAGTSSSGTGGMSPQDAQAEYQKRMMEQQRAQQQQQMQMQMQQKMQSAQQQQTAMGTPMNQGAQMTVNDLSNIQQANANRGMGAPQSQPQPAPQPNPGMSATAASGTSAQQAMRQRMLNSRNQATGGSQNVMQQGDTYDPGQTGQNGQQPQQNGTEPIVPEQQNDIANNTIINTTDTTGQANPKDKKSLVLKVVGGLIVAVIGIFVIFSFVGKKQPDEEPVDEWNEDDYDWIVPEEYYSYTTEQLDALREMGWTADEIEAAQTQQIPANTLIKQAKAARNAYVQMTLAPMYDTASYEYKHFIEQTWLTLPQRDDMNDWTNIASYYQERKNLDYEKIDVYGKQLFIKVYLDDNLHEDWFFITVTPEEWAKLDDFGNIVINYTYVTRYLGDDIWTAEEDFEEYYITEAHIEFTN